MAPPKLDLTLYLVTDSSLLPPNTTLADHVRESIKGGVTVVQLREKKLQTAEFIKLGKEIHAVTKEFGVPLIINDRVDVAMAVGCEGVHIGWDDMDYKTARRLLGPDAIIGLSVSSHDQLALALEAGPTYLGLGPVYATATKPDHGTPLGISGLCSLLEKMPVHFPAVAIGGINLKNIHSVVLPTSDLGFQSTKRLDGVAIASAIITSTKPQQTCRELRNLIHPDNPRAALPSQSKSVEEFIPQLLPLLERTRRNPPLVHHITNNVSNTLCANVTLAIGASPIMSENPAEFEDLAMLNGGNVALVLNMGTFLNENDTKAIFLKALGIYNRDSPVVFDPVGCGATAARGRFAKAIMDCGLCDVIKGNEGEILSIAGEQVNMRGVDGAGSSGGKEREKELAKVCSELARRNGNIIAMTGATDIVSDGLNTYLLRNGHPIQTRVTGIGCALSSVIAATLASAIDARADEKTIAVVAAISAFNVAAEKANSAPKPAGPASWAVRFVDELANLQNLSEEDMKIEKITV